MFFAASASLDPLFALFSLLLLGALGLGLLSLKLGQSLLIGYFLCGFLVSSFGVMDWLLPAEEAASLVGNFAELGIVLLMFTIGVEFDLSELKHLRRIALRAGLTQVLGTTAVALLVGLCLLGLAPIQALFFGFLISLSSTALALKGFEDLGMTNHPAARTALGVALLQDVLVILALLFLPAESSSETATQAASTTHPALNLLFTALRGSLFFGICYLLSAYGLPWLFRSISRTRSRELFTLCVSALCVAIAWAASALGLNLALGAFAAGAVMSGSVYRHRVLADILPFKDLFLAIFFISVGLQINFADLLDRWAIYLGSTIAILAGKTMVTLVAARLLGLPAKSCLFAAFSLASLGEFALVLLPKGGALTPELQSFAAWLATTTVLTMSFVPALLKLTRHLSPWLEKLPGFRKVGTSLHGQAVDALEDHSILVGYGPVGKRLRSSLAEVDVPVLVVELNAETVRTLQQENVPVLYADIRQPETLQLAHLQRARALVITFPDLAVTQAAITAARQIAPDILIFARAKFQSEVEALHKLNVTGLIHDERESGYSLAKEVLTAYRRDDEAIEAELDQLRMRQE